ncbi:MAG TPA: hypothetical protein VGN46_12365 [Luteibacter sp.]|jgi:hypothetical protein|uniref:hypothetical protein n=1 Tax=Luteibacter sp. TaxID=1886636 RepID=UPI002F3E64CF
MRNTKLILAMLAGCTVLSGAAFAQDASKAASASTAATPTQSSSDSMKSDSMKSGSMDKKGDEAGAMKSTHKKHKKAAEAAPAKASTAGGM